METFSTSSPEDDPPSISEELDVVDQLHSHHVTQSALEADCIRELEKQPSKSSYPLDGRNLELSKLMKKKRRRLEMSVGDIEKKQEGTSRQRDHSTAKDDDNKDNQEDEVSTIRITDIPHSSRSYYISRNFWEKLYDFQKIGVRFLLSKFEQNTGGLLADEMGLGKSIQTVAFVDAVLRRHSTEQVLLICPTTLVENWEAEFSKWAPSIVVERWVQLRHLSKKSPRVIVISYEQFRSKAESSGLLGRRFIAAILDEAQRIRNPDAKITIACKKIDCVCRIALSGSPIQNNLTELWSIFDFVAPGRLGTLPTFQEELGQPIETGTRPKASFTESQLSLKCAMIVRELTAPLMLRRLKSEFADELELANKEEQVLFCQLTRDQIEVYCKFLSTETVRSVVGQSATTTSDRRMERGKTFYALSILRRIANHPDLLLSDYTDVDDFGSPERSGKLQVLIPLLDLWHRQNRRCLVFSQSLGMLDVLELTLRRRGMTYSRMDGSTGISKRAEIVDVFDAARHSADQRHDSAAPFCLLLSTRVGGVGLNLTAADRVVIFDPDWNPMTDTQARERSWRIGQKNEVKIFRLIAAETIEEIICKRQIYKHYLAQKILTDPRQTKVGDWDHLEDMFKAPTRAIGQLNSGSSKPSIAMNKILKSFASIEQDAQKEEGAAGAAAALPGSEAEAIQGLVGTILNQESFEMPKLSPALVDTRLIESAAAKAVETIMAEQRQITQDGDITIPTWTGKHGGGSSTTTLNRSKSLLSKISAATPSDGAIATVRYESTEHVIEKTFVREMRKFFLTRNYYSATTGEVLEKFKDKIPDGADEIFRNCLRQLCEFDSASSVWTLKRQHV